MSAGDQNYSRAAQFKCLSDSTVPLSVWIVQITAARPCTRFPQHKSVWLWVQGNPVVRKGTGANQNRPTDTTCSANRRSQLSRKFRSL